MGDLVLYEGAGTLAAQEEDLLYERVATHYLRLQEERNGRKVKVAEALSACLEAHPNEYVESVALAAIKTREFDDYLASRRKEHLLRSLVPALYAAEYGNRLGALAADELAKRLEDEPDRLETKDLLSIIKTGYELASKVDKKVEEVTETQNVQVNLDVKTLLLGATPEQLAELTRRMVTDGGK